MSFLGAYDFKIFEIISNYAPWDFWNKNTKCGHFSFPNQRILFIKFLNKWAKGKANILTMVLDTSNNNNNYKSP